MILGAYFHLDYKQMFLSVGTNVNFLLPTPAVGSSKGAEVREHPVSGQF